MFIKLPINKILLRHNSLIVNGTKYRYDSLTEDTKEIVNTMLSKGAYATAMLYLNANNKLQAINEKAVSTQQYNEYLTECKDLLKECVVETEARKFKPLANVGKLEIMESANNIARGKGSKIFIEDFRTLNEAEKVSDRFKKSGKTRDEFMKALNDVSKQEYDNEINRDEYDDEVKKIQQTYVKRDRHKKNVNEDCEGTQCSDIAPKKDQEVGSGVKKAPRTSRNKRRRLKEEVVDFEYIGKDDWGRHIIKSKKTGTYLGDTNLTKPGKERDLSKADWCTYTGNDPYDGEPYCRMRPDIQVNIVNKEDIPTGYQEEDYRLLSRLKQDCDYFLKNGNGYEGNLWAHTVDKQIAKMREIYNKLEEKPDWLTSEQIDEYENKMKNFKKYPTDRFGAPIIKEYANDIDWNDIVEELWDDYFTEAIKTRMKKDLGITRDDDLIKELVNCDEKTFVSYIVKYLGSDVARDYIPDEYLNESYNFNIPKNHKFKGFMMTESGHYERGNFVLINEAGKIKAVSKKSLKEDYFDTQKKIKEKEEQKLISLLKKEFPNGKVSNPVHSKYSGDRVQLTVNGKRIYFYYMDMVDDDGNLGFMIVTDKSRKQSYTDTTENIVKYAKNLIEKRFTESVNNINRSNIMENPDVIEICKTFSSRTWNQNYKIEGNEAIYEYGTKIKFIVNDDNEIEYYFINSQGDTSRAALVYDWSLLDNVTDYEEE